jgi:hypothetical protein
MFGLFCPRWPFICVGSTSRQYQFFLCLTAAIDLSSAYLAFLCVSRQYFFGLAAALDGHTLSGLVAALYGGILSGLAAVPYSNILSGLAAAPHGNILSSLEAVPPGNINFFRLKAMINIFFASRLMVVLPPHGNL